MFIPRFKQTLAGAEDGLVTPLDHKLGGIGIIGTLILISVSYVQAEQQYKEGITLQTGRAEIKPLPIKHEVAVKIKRPTYQVPQRALQLTMEVTNKSDKPIELGELNFATLCFFNPAVQHFDARLSRRIGD